MVSNHKTGMALSKNDGCPIPILLPINLTGKMMSHEVVGATRFLSDKPILDVLEDVYICICIIIDIDIAHNMYT